MKNIDSGVGFGDGRFCSVRSSSAAFGGRFRRGFRPNGRPLVLRQPVAANEHCPSWFLFYRAWSLVEAADMLLGLSWPAFIVMWLTERRKVNLLAQGASHAP